MTMMLASVRNVIEADTVWRCGADWIDIKDPSAGALGAADVRTVRAIVEHVAKRVPVSATIGDSWDDPEVIPARAAQMTAAGVDYVKAGLNAYAVNAAALKFLDQTVANGANLIVVCKAESAPTPLDIAALARTGIRGIMLDTAEKAGPGLPELLAREYLAAFVKAARGLGLLSGLAGRLRIDDIAALAALGSDYLGFRSALCENAKRSHDLSGEATLAVRAQMTIATAQQTKTNNEVA